MGKGHEKRRHTAYLGCVAMADIVDVVALTLKPDWEGYCRATHFEAWINSQLIQGGIHFEYAHFEHANSSEIWNREK